jgi:hypothetical protein
MTANTPEEAFRSRQPADCQLHPTALLQDYQEPLEAAFSFFFCFFSLMVSFGLFKVFCGFSCPLGMLNRSCPRSAHLSPETGAGQPQG